MKYIGNKEKLRRANQKIVNLKRQLKQKDEIIDLMTECSVICGLERLLDYLAKKHIYYAQFKNTTIMHEGKDGNVENFYIRRSKE